MAGTAMLRIEMNEVEAGRDFAAALGGTGAQADARFEEVETGRVADGLPVLAVAAGVALDVLPANGEAQVDVVADGVVDAGRLVVGVMLRCERDLGFAVVDGREAEEVVVVLPEADEGLLEILLGVEVNAGGDGEIAFGWRG